MLVKKSKQEGKKNVSESREEKENRFPDFSGSLLFT
jgi:hypothetical protein